MRGVSSFSDARISSLFLFSILLSSFFLSLLSFFFLVATVRRAGEIYKNIRRDH